MKIQASDQLPYPPKYTELKRYGLLFQQFNQIRKYSYASDTCMWQGFLLIIHFDNYLNYCDSKFLSWHNH